MTPKTKKADKAEQGPSILKQLMGAVVGGSLALGIYYAYDYGAPKLTGWLTVPQQKFSVWKGTTSQKDLKPEENRRLAARTRNLVNVFGQKRKPAAMDIDVEEEKPKQEKKTGADFWKDAWKDDVSAEDSEEGWDTEEVEERVDVPMEEEVLEIPDYEPPRADETQWEDTWEAPAKADPIPAEALPDSGPATVIALMGSGALVGWRRSRKRV